jgi:hypothetical protein
MLLPAYSPKRMMGIVFALVALLALPAGCAAQTQTPPTSAPVAVLQPTEPAPVPVQPTWTRPPAPRAGSTAVLPAQATPRPTHTPLQLPPATATPSPTASATGTATATAPATPGLATTIVPPAGQPNLLPNPSFEEGWYHPSGIDELQVPNRWVLDWLEGPNHLDPDPWNAWVRPELRVLSPEFLPPAEHSLFIWDGKQTLKAFKGSGAISFSLQTTVFLEPGSYLFVVHVFPDLVDEYGSNGEKIWAPDPLSGDIAFIVTGVQQPWQLPRFGQKNRFTQVVDVEQAGLIQLGLAVRGRWAITNNGWFLDDWALYPLATPQPTEN